MKIKYILSACVLYTATAMINLNAKTLFDAADLHSDVLLNILEDPGYLDKDKPGQHTSFRTIKQGNYRLIVVIVSGDFFFDRNMEKPGWISRRLWKELGKYRLKKREFAGHCIDLVKKTFKDKKDFVLVTGRKDLDTVEKEKKTGILLGVEGMRVAENPGDVEWLYENGVRVFGLVWNSDNKFAHSHKSKSGLTEEGKELVRAIAKAGGIIDLSHASERTVLDAIETAGRDCPFMASHSGVRQISDVSRNPSDEAIKAIAGTGGIIGATFYRTLIKNRNNKSPVYATTDDVLDTIDCMAKMIPISNVAIGTDYGSIIPPKGLENAGCIQKIGAGMLKRGYTQEEANKVMGANALKFLRKALK
ncbi:hypothetical protein COY52_12255 [Candidatus Desantisbacteria bacterium CG_4_10_14_0_8_um_filter_48_22]|uniref:Peptidase M19 n=1 Tax=Candidatus Desantisbacteria bacterium CG_4_10_14_0_8_um_filter_48_22 TaxID=1974543 RepID=A0A2M7S4P5_9BACT|nr:MAG: hypothetical protein AUJ67_01440 [Candidatus Desantisbacteria bacterium CG1_02_49_89]PIV57105.1 MAG: hypothetical protein COS16_01955 [Candidatus Desantisbacteria bacterium CG02_land_8_20_14_3_00_49_13]PIZ14530.1 MAG: hypothetical protein COY52_12255 [Candidatus Desantisbacteria bacterium CG_4_10_14_0_8_um_filter_48_22]PJB27423.1 MAG: hypothetical protein CO111_05465 [Candidatus Desantisbacteria bacterium CG_4_9_14_3_um_filter_50_7]